MKLTKKQWETILKASGATEFEVIETPGDSYKIKFMPGTDYEFISDNLNIQGYFVADYSSLAHAPSFVSYELERMLIMIKKLTYAVSDKATELGTAEECGELFMVRNTLHYLTQDGEYEKKFVLYEGEQTTVVKVDEVLEQVNCDPNHPHYKENAAEDFELYRKALEIAFEVNLIDNDFLVKFENGILISYLEILLGEELNYGPYKKWEEVKEDPKLLEEYGEEKVKPLIEIVEVIKYLDAE